MPVQYVKVKYVSTNKYVGQTNFENKLNENHRKWQNFMRKSHNKLIFLLYLKCNLCPKYCKSAFF